MQNQTSLFLVPRKLKKIARMSSSQLIVSWPASDAMKFKHLPTTTTLKTLTDQRCALMQTLFLLRFLPKFHVDFSFKKNKSQSHEKKSVQDDGTDVFRCQRDAEFDHGQSNSWQFRWQSICLHCRRPGFDLWVRKILSRRKWQPTPVPLPGKSHGQRSLVGYNPWGHKGSDTTEQLHFNFHNQINLLKPPHLPEAVR